MLSLIYSLRFIYDETPLIELRKNKREKRSELPSLDYL